MDLFIVLKVLLPVYRSCLGDKNIADLPSHLLLCRLYRRPRQQEHQRLQRRGHRPGRQRQLLRLRQARHGGRVPPRPSREHQQRKWPNRPWMMRMFPWPSGLQQPSASKLRKQHGGPSRKLNVSDIVTILPHFHHALTPDTSCPQNAMLTHAIVPVTAQLDSPYGAVCCVGVMVTFFVWFEGVARPRCPSFPWILIRRGAANRP